jgi:integrase
MVHLLFMNRGKPLGQDYLNGRLIPALCRKAGVDVKDARGRITSHRARSTIATQLFNAKEPMSLFELQAWLGHRSPETTQHYTRVTPTKTGEVICGCRLLQAQLATGSGAR